MTLAEFQSSIYPLKHKLFRFARKIVVQTEEAEDVVQDVFIRLWNKRDKLNEYRSVEALAMITTKNICLDRKRIKKYPVENLENHRDFLENMPQESGADHSDIIYGVRQAMKQLPEQQQLIIHLRDVEGYEYQEIAEILNMNENAIRVALSRGRKRVRELITNTKAYAYHGH